MLHTTPTAFDVIAATTRALTADEAAFKARTGNPVRDYLAVYAKMTAPKPPVSERDRMEQALFTAFGPHIAGLGRIVMDADDAA